MTLSEAKQKFISEWGCLGVNWGINRTMGQIHALLLVSHKEMCADQIMQALKISRGNVNMNLRALIDWGIVYKVIKTGERKEFFKGEKNIWKVFQKITEHRKKKELDPVLKLIDELSPLEAECNESEEFCRAIRDIKLITSKADQTLQTIIDSDAEWLSKAFTRVI